MLIKFTIKNWQSFKEEAVFSMIAGREEQHKDHLYKIAPFGIKLLPISAIYGSNASGKTKFFNALSFAKNLITKGLNPGNPIPRHYFKLDKSCSAQPTKFSFSFLIKATIYEFSFAVDDEKVIEEKLVDISREKEHVLYERKGEQVHFPEIWNNDQRLHFVAAGTRDNVLFLTNSIDQKVEHFKDVYEWFSKRLLLISPQSKFIGDFDITSTANVLSDFDIGIAQLREKLTLVGEDLPEEIKIQLLKDMQEGQKAFSYKGQLRYFKKLNSELYFSDVIPIHKSSEGEDVEFKLEDESHGTKRLIDLLPAFHNLLHGSSDNIIFIDELDSALHSLLVRNLLEGFLKSRSGITESGLMSQLIFTTHDISLMEQKLFRRDEMWLTEKDATGASSLLAISEYKGIRADKDIRKLYLQGHLGGIPKITNLI